MIRRLALAAVTLGGALLAAQPPAHAIGCISGGLAGAVAGHMAHHGVLGAVGGCIAGHEYHKHQQRRLMEQRSSRDFDNGADSGSTRNRY
jgi:uncharacterized protein YcfJ